MIPVDHTQNIETTGEVKSIGKVTTTLKNIPFLVVAVTDRIYKDKPGAIVREYNTNAWDEHIKAKLPVTDITVTLPSMNDPMFRIRDFGGGLSMEEIRDIYCILGESTKRNSNEFNGQLGLGCKSGFAYGESFLVTSWVNGVKTVYNIIKGDSTKEGDALRLSEEVMAESDRTGIEIAIPIKIGDLHTIHAKAADFFKYWAILPTLVNMDESELTRMHRWRNTSPFLSGEGWEIRPNSSSYSSYGKSVAVMGQVAYPIDWNMLRSKMALTPQKRIFTEILQSNEVVLKFPIGDLNFTINREELEYTETTYRNLEAKLEMIFETLESAIVEKFSKAKTIWEAKRIYLSLFGKNIGDREDNDSMGDNKALKVLDGDFYRLEEMFKNKLHWNGVAINSPHFESMNLWDVVRPDGITENGQDPVTPCLLTYKRKKSRVKRFRCTASENNRITPYDGVKVVIIDGRNVSMMQTIARYYLLGSNENVRKVHLLRFADETQQKAFFAHYHFDTAEYTLLSTVLDDIKTWQKANRKTYSRSGGGGGGGGGTACLRYIDVASGCVEESDVALRDLEDGVYAALHRKEIHVNGYTRDIDQSITCLRSLAKYADMNLDRVYLIPNGKLDAKWFQTAKAEGQWVELGEYIKENEEVYVTSTMRKRSSFGKFCNNTDQTNVLSWSWAQSLRNALNGDYPELNAYLEAIGGEPNDFYELNYAQRFFGLTQTKIQPVESFDYAALSKAVMEKYPLLQFLDVCGEETPDSSVKLAAIVDYIQSVESKRNNLTSELVPV